METEGDYDAANLYLATLRDGVTALSGTGMSGSKIFVLGKSNPFPMILNAPPPKGDMPWLQWERTLNASAFVPAETLLADADVVMEPKPAGEKSEASQAETGLSALYGSYIADHFEDMGETGSWRIHRRRPAPPPKIGMNAVEPS